MKESKKIDKYLSLAREVKKLWNMKTIVIPVVVRDFGIFPKNFGIFPKNLRLRELEIQDHNTTKINF